MIKIRREIKFLVGCILVFIFTMCITTTYAETKLKEDAIQEHIEEIEFLKQENKTKELFIENLKTTINIQDTEMDMLRDEVELKYKDNELLYYLGKFEITFYCHCVKCCGKSNGITASGIKAVDGITIAADTSKIPLGSYVYIDGIGCRIVQDRGGVIKGNKIDVYISDHNKALEMGRLKEVAVWKIK